MSDSKNNGQVKRRLEGVIVC